MNGDTPICGVNTPLLFFWGLANFFIGGLEYWWHSCAPTNATRSTSSCLVLRTCRLYRANRPSYPASRQRPTTRLEPRKKVHIHTKGEGLTMAHWHGPGVRLLQADPALTPILFGLGGMVRASENLDQKRTKLGLHLGRPWEQRINVRKHKGTNRPC